MGIVILKEQNTMTLIEQTPGVDVSLWPDGRGFDSADAWWNLMDRDEKQRLDNLMGIALLDTDVRDRLVNKRDKSLLTDFGLSQETQNWIREINATSLIELAQAIVSKVQSEAFVVS
jgi:hypothetical protein